jgi:glutamate--cysteine ligase
VPLDGRLPGDEDLQYHLTTLFPPVRPRRWLEIRYLDSVPDAIWPAVVFTLVTLLDNPAAAEIATRATAPVSGEWDLAARAGLADSRLRSAALTCVAAAAEHAPAELAGPMARLLANVEAGRCPGDDFSDLVVEHGIPTALTERAKGDS